MFRRLRYHLEMRSARRRGTHRPPPERIWVHPSELPGSFESVVLPPPHPAVARWFQVAVASTASVLLASGAVLLGVSATAPAGASVGSHLAATAASLPSSDRAAARAMIPIVIYEDSHVGTATAMVLPPGNLAVTTTPIPNGTSVEAWSSVLRNWMALTVKGTDEHLGVTVLGLPRNADLPIMPIAPLAPAVDTAGAPTSLTALAAIPSSTSRVEFEYAPAYLSASEAAVTLGRSVIATTRGQSLAGTISGTIVLNAGGQAVAASVPALGASSFVSANFLELLGQRMVLGDAKGHGWLQLSGADTASGAAAVRSVARHGDAWGLLRPGDRILAIESSRVGTMADVGSFLYTSSPAERVTITVLRDGKIKDVVVRLAASP